MATNSSSARAAAVDMFYDMADRVRREVDRGRSIESSSLEEQLQASLKLLATAGLIVRTTRADNDT